MLDSSLRHQTLDSPAKKGWTRVGINHHHGITLPLRALRTKESAGIGEFFDILPLFAWCKEIGLDLIQLLPLNDSRTDPSPYNAISSCALNPLLISIHALPNCDATPALREQKKALQALSLLPRLDYPIIYDQKLSWLKEYWKTISPIDLKTRQDFIEQHHWVEFYARIHKGDPDFYIDLQILAFQQLQIVACEAKKQGILLMGDIPILISRDSADVHENHQFFDLSHAAGAPPDVYDRDGQYWGFPIYKWDELKKDHYLWWKNRLHTAELHYDLYRIDHVVGFFRIWAIPIGKKAKEGGFIPENPAEWIPQGEEILKMMLDTTSMLPIAEDLGTVPPEVRNSLAKLGICGTKVMRWERVWNGDQHFIPVELYPPLSLTCVSTQDSQTLSLWWRDCPDEAKAYAAAQGWKYVPLLDQEKRYAILRDSHRSGSLFHVNLLQEYLACHPELIWPSPEDERLNVPGTVSPHNWTYRFRPSVEELIGHTGLKTTLKGLIT